MSFLKRIGEAAAESAVTEKPKGEKFLKSIKSGSSYRVYIPGPSAFAEYESHGIFNKNGPGIFTTPCVLEDDCPYCQAVNQMYKEYNETEVESLKETAGALKKKQRFLLGFFNLEDGQPLVLDFSKKQASQLRNTIKKQEKKLDKFAFEISKSGSQQATVVSLDIVVDDEDLTEKERANFEKVKGTAFNPEHFEVLMVKDRKGGLDDLKNFGYDISKIGAGTSTEQTTTEETLGSEF